MSENTKRTRGSWRRRREAAPDRLGRDAGLTLPEILISVMVTGLLVASMATATQVVLRQNDNTSGRVNNSRSEQSVGTWLPSDLASAESVDDGPAASPCGTQCPPNVNVSGTNTLMLTWHGSVPGETTSIPTTTTVSYRYVESIENPGEYEVLRVECFSIDGAAPTCTQVTVLHGAEPPPPGVEYIVGETKPYWVMLVTLAVDPAAPGDGGATGGCDQATVADPTYYCKNGRRVTVTVNGGGDIAAARGGQDQITLSAGGTNREPNLSTTNLTAAPTFAATRSRCGGNFGLLVDTSGSIGGNMSYVRSGVDAFINAFAGTPIKLQVVSFSSNATTLGAGAAWTKYYDMLVDTDVSALRTLVTGLSSTGFTNWEDAMFRMFRNSDGSVQQVLPDTLIFFTDGMPTYNRLNSTTASAPAVAASDDSGLPTAGSSGSYNQLSWNRANRIIRLYEADLEKLIGVFVGTDINGTSTWLAQGPGYHLKNFVHGYHDTWEQGFHVSNPQRGYHVTYEYAGSGLTYQYAGSGLTYQFSTTGLTYEYAATGLIYEKKSSGTWKATTKTIYDAGNLNNGTTDSYRTRIDTTVTLGGWTTLGATQAAAKTLYDKSNTVNTDADGFRVRVTGTVGPTWTNTTKAVFDLSNTTANATDGYRIVAGTLSSWTNTTKAFYDLNNALAGPTDGFKTVASGPGTWTATTEAYYLLNNTTAGTDQTDGYRMNTLYSAPFSQWEVTPEATYLANNTTTDDTDGWSGAIAYTAPFSTWISATQSAYNTNNLTPDATDGWRVTHNYSTPYSAWETVTESAYNTGNLSWGNTDGWDATKDYSEPYTFHEGYSSYSRKNTDILKDIVAPGGVVPAQKTGTKYTNSKEATYYELPTWDLFSNAMTSMALAECGGTVTLQTKINGVNAADPFTYQSSLDLTTATTSAQYRSGTFDFDLAGGGSVNVTISPLPTSDLSHYNPGGWTCKAAGVAYPFTTTPVDGGPWTSINLTVSPNQAISCVNAVTLK